MSKTADQQSIQIDARGPRFSASLTVIVLAFALVTSNPLFIVVQATVFAVGAFLGPQFTPYAYIFKEFIKPKLKSAPHFEDVKPPQFAQVVGFLFTVVALAGFALDIPALFSIAVAFALAAAFLNAAFNFCLGCQIYLLYVRTVR